MSKARIAERRRLAEANMSLSYAAALPHILEFSRQSESMRVMGRELERLAANEERALRARSAVNANYRRENDEFPYQVDGVWHLPNVQGGKVPMVCSLMVHLFPVSLPKMPWESRVVATRQVGSTTQQLLVSGRGMTQFHLDILLGVIRAAKGALDTPVNVSRAAFMTSIGRGNSTAAVSKLHRALIEIQSHVFEYVTVDAYGLVCSSTMPEWRLVKGIRRQDFAPRGSVGKSTRLEFHLGQEFVKFFDIGFGSKGWTAVDLNVRSRLDGKRPLALWLHAYLSCYPLKDGHARRLEDLHRLSASQVARLTNFKIDVLEAARYLIEQRVLRPGGVSVTKDVFMFRGP